MPKTLNRLTDTRRAILAGYILDNVEKLRGCNNEEVAILANHDLSFEVTVGNIPAAFAMLGGVSLKGTKSPETLRRIARAYTGQTTTPAPAPAPALDPVERMRKIWPGCIPISDAPMYAQIAAQFWLGLMDREDVLPMSREECWGQLYFDPESGRLLMPSDEGTRTSLIDARGRPTWQP